jgi:selenocysteine lyase/cysteine desulfurase
MNTTTTSPTEFLELPDERLAYDVTADGTLVLRHEFQPTGVYLDSATYGLPPKVALQALSAVTAAWASGRYDPFSCDQAVGRARSTFARLHSVFAEDVAIGHQVSPMVGLIAASLPPRARVLAAEGDFTSLLFPLIAAGCDVRTIPLERLADAVDGRTDLVAVSAVQSADGRLADLDAISTAAASYDALTLVDATQASGWLPLDAGRFSVVVTGGYKWLCHPRGTAFMTIARELRDRIVPLAAGWYASEYPWDSCYGTPLRLASDARRFDVSPAWLSWHAAAVTLELFEAVGLGRIHEHNLALANRLRTGLGLEPGDSAIVSLDAANEAAERLACAGVKAAVRANRIRLSCHLYNDEEDVDRTLEVLTDLIHAGAGSSSTRSGIARA